MCLASKYLNEINSIVTNLKSDMDKLGNKQSHYDKRINEIYHKLETTKFNACEGYYISKDLQETLRKRRLVKAEYFRMKGIYDTLRIEMFDKQLPKANANVKKSIDVSKNWVDKFGFNFSDIEDEVLH